MALIINPRGASGSGKTELVRRILAEHGWERGRAPKLDGVEPIRLPGRDRPFAYRLAHPRRARPLVVVGDYAKTSGGCDTIRARDGGLAEIVRFAMARASGGDDLLLEGLHLSSETSLSAELAAACRLHILLLNTPASQCARNLASRRRTARRSLVDLEQVAAEELGRIGAACHRLARRATVEALDFETALSRTKMLLGLDEPSTPDRAPADA